MSNLQFYKNRLKQQILKQEKLKDENFWHFVLKILEETADWIAVALNQLADTIWQC